ncbi:hypothetical protein CAOG_05514 [Capsaspora owczarzaki ATCC 30864]|uniref:Laminin G domain-containing protein n=1 Tax=Capsaspora owczarzaki (strain ATCC 30864) TaxID=595528 RepID=A0A0D2WTJ0_CAPO3|nr:hypothetical protein CAOG_05514 [Capsaspora owczarzaki ATCC 30864]KJE94978.1 hypothetical protein CAOG_005514 [Capsaspora owczarzaki ATCC 30864]|eukprot:XP_004346187.1 hypothetical protein CAOG_05514 [Capsaspora owczarzaki ATCC 30864]
MSASAKTSHLACILVAVVAMYAAVVSADCPSDEPAVFFGEKGYLTFPNAYGLAINTHSTLFKQMSLDLKLRKGPSASREFRVFSVRHNYWVDFLDVWVNVLCDDSAQVVVNFNAGQGPVSFSADFNELLDHEWHTLEVTTSPGRVFIYIDTEMVQEHYYLGGPTLNVNVNGNVKVGGTRSGDMFHGCIRNIVLEHLHFDGRDAYPTGEVKYDCSISQDASLPTGNERVEFFPLSSRTLTDIRFWFRGTTTDGVLYLQKGASDSVTVELYNNALNVILRNNAGNDLHNEQFAGPFDDNVWREFSLSRFGSEFTAKISTPGFYPDVLVHDNLLNSGLITLTGNSLFGGLSPAFPVGGGNATQGYQGCLRDLSGGGVPRLIQDALDKPGVVLDDCDCLQCTNDAQRGCPIAFNGTGAVLERNDEVAKVTLRSHMTEVDRVHVGRSAAVHRTCYGHRQQASANSES